MSFLIFFIVITSYKTANYPSNDFKIIPYNKSEQPFYEVILSMPGTVDA